MKPLYTPKHLNPSPVYAKIKIVRFLFYALLKTHLGTENANFKRRFDNPFEHKEFIENLGLPAPTYETSQQTSFTLYNCFYERFAPHASYATKSKPDMPHEQGSVKKALRSIGEHLTKI